MANNGRLIKDLKHIEKLLINNADKANVMFTVTHATDGWDLIEISDVNPNHKDDVCIDTSEHYQ